MKVSVIVPFREKDFLVESCVKSLKQQSYKNIEIILVSDRARFEDKKVVSLVDSTCKGVGDKRNLGAKHATGEILFFLDSDCVAKRDTIEKLVKTFKNYPTDAVTCKPLAPRKATVFGRAIGLEYEDRFNQMGECYVTVAATTCFGITRTVFKKIGGFKDYSKGFAIGEDWDFSTKLSNSGFRIYHTNKVEVYHEQLSDTLARYLKKQFWHARYRVTHFWTYGKIKDQYASREMFVSSSLLLALPVMLRLYKKEKDPTVFILPVISLLRSFAWLLGVAAGTLFDRSK
jgi:GT2 family glycosyltransferase